MTHIGHLWEFQQLKIVRFLCLVEVSFAKSTWSLSHIIFGIFLPLVTIEKLLTALLLLKRENWCVKLLYVYCVIYFLWIYKTLEMIGCFKHAMLQLMKLMFFQRGSWNEVFWRKISERKWRRKKFVYYIIADHKSPFFQSCKSCSRDFFWGL